MRFLALRSRWFKAEDRVANSRRGSHLSVTTGDASWCVRLWQKIGCNQGELSALGVLDMHIVVTLYYPLTGRTQSTPG